MTTTHPFFTTTSCLVATVLLAASGWAATPPAGKPAVVQPPAAGAPAQGVFPAGSKPKLWKMSLANAELSPGMVELTANLQSDRASEVCQFTVNVVTNDTSGTVLNTQVFGPLGYSAALPAPALKIPLSKMNTGKYRLNVAAVATPNAACTGAVSADFEVKRKSLFITPDITGISITDQGYNKGNKLWPVAINGKSEGACAYQIRFRHEATGKITDFTGISTIPMTDMVSFAQEPTYGEYQVTVSPWIPTNNNGTPSCMGVQTAKVRHAAPALGGLDFMKISYSNVVVSTLMGETAFDADGATGSAMPKAIRMDMQFTNQPANGQQCAYTLVVAKGGVEKSVAYKSGDTVDVLAAIKQGPGWGVGEYTIAAHASPANGNLNLPSCLGKQVHKMTVVDGGAIASGLNNLTHSFSCNNTWDSNSMLYSGDKVYCEVLVKTKITGAACNYSISVQAQGEAPRVYRQTHYIEGGDMIGFEIYRGANKPEVMDQLHAISHAVHVWASDQDKVGGSGCSGSLYNANVHF